MVSRTSLVQGLLAVLLTTGLLPSRVAFAENLQTPEIREIRRDGTGSVWGTDKSAVPGIYLLDGNARWQLATPPGLPGGARPICLGLRADGRVLCLWRLSNENYQCSEHLGHESRALASFGLPGAWAQIETQLTGDSKGGMWLTTQGAPQIYRLKPDGNPECLHSISSDECRPSNHQNRASMFWGTVRVFETEDGTLWFWVNQSASGDGVLRGALSYDGKDFALHEFGLPDKRMGGALSLLAPKDSNHFWIGLSGWGLYVLDLHTFQTEKVVDQPREASYTPFVKSDSHGDWFFVLGQGQNRTEGSGACWRFTMDGKWEKLIDDVDARFTYTYQQDRLWAPADNGIYLGSNENGLWFLPSDGSPPRKAGWQQHFPLATPRGFVRLSDGRWLGVSKEGQTWVGTPETLFAESSSSDHSKAGVLRTRAPLRADARRHLWSLFDNHFTSLREWDGHHWTEHPFPPGLPGEPYAELLNVDLRGRVWIRSLSRSDGTLIYDPAADHWDIYQSFHAALEAQGGRRDAEFTPWNGAFDVAHFGTLELPRYGPSGQICCLSRKGPGIDVFDGHSWRHWKAEEITGRSNAGIYAAPFFNQAGQPSVNDHEQTFSCVDGSKWQVTGSEAGFADMTGVNHLRHPSLPAGLKLPFTPESRALDNQGVWWLTWHGMLYRARETLNAPVFLPTEPQPFADGRKVGGAFVDALGNTFLSSDDSNSVEYVIVGPPGPPPQTTLAEDKVRPEGEGPIPPDRIVIGMSTTALPIEGKTRYLWRLDSGPWTAQAAEGPAQVSFDAVPGGPHRFEARSFDSALQTDATPAVLDFEIHLDPAAQVAGYIAQLADPDYALRKAAVAALAHQPELAEPALRTARAAADSDAQWWIDAAMQQLVTDRHAALRSNRESDAQSTK